VWCVGDDSAGGDGGGRGCRPAVDSCRGRVALARRLGRSVGRVKPRRDRGPPHGAALSVSGRRFLEPVRDRGLITMSAVSYSFLRGILRAFCETPGRSLSVTGCRPAVQTENPPESDRIICAQAVGGDKTSRMFHLRSAAPACWRISRLSPLTWRGTCRGRRRQRRQHAAPAGPPHQKAPRPVRALADIINRKATAGAVISRPGGQRRAASRPFRTVRSPPTAEASRRRRPAAAARLPQMGTHRFPTARPFFHCVSARRLEGPKRNILCFGLSRPGIY
jgi:hypothetical protein